MKKKIFTLLFLLLSVFGFSLKADAAPATIKTTSLGKSSNLISGVPTVYVKQTTNSIYLYCEEALKKYPANMTIRLRGEAPKGMVYILKNKPNTGNAYTDYYIMQTAVWWYRDIWSGTSNISQAAKNTIINGRNSNTTYAKIYNLVEGARNYSEVIGSISISGNNKFTEQGSYYVSDTITVKKFGIANYNIDLVNAPYGTTITNRSGNTFKVSVPKSSVPEGKTISFQVKVSSSYTINTAYEYEYGANYQYVLYGKLDTVNKPVSASLNLSVTKTEENIFKVYKVDEDGDYVKGAKLALYEGNCTNKTCSSRNLYATWTTTNSAKVFENIPKGIYTLVEISAPSGYEIADKMYVNISSNNGNFSIKMVDYEIEENRLTINKVDENGKYVSGAKLSLYSEDCTNKTCSSSKLYKTWTSGTTAKVFTDIPVGTYTLVEVEAPNGYKVAAKQKVVVNSASGSFTIKMIDEKIKTTKVKISKTDVTGSKEIPGATLVVKDSSGSVVDKWVSTSEAHYVTVDPGVYTLTETTAPKGYKLSSTTITFKVDEDLNLYELVDGKYTKVDHIKMINELVDKSAIKINKLDSKTNKYVSGAILMIKNNKGETVATITTTDSASYITLEEGEYVLSEEAAPSGYEKTDAKIYFTVDAEGKIKIKGSNGYVDAVEITIYNQKEEDEIIVVPTTGLSSTITYVVGTLVVSVGAVMLYRNGKQN